MSASSQIFRRHAFRGALVIGLAASLSGCLGGVPNNRSLESVHQPVVSRQNYTLDVATGMGGVPSNEQRRLAGWFEALGLRYGDRITIDDPSANPSTHETIQAVADRYSMIVGGDAPATSGYVNPGTVRVVVTRSTASVPGCPDWRARSDANPMNATSPGYGCATNGNLAAMVADPEHLLNGATGSASSTIIKSDKAIEMFRNAAPSGGGGGKVAGGGATGGN